MVVHHAGGRLTVDLNALVANWLDLKSAAEPGDCAAVVKANAYGLGLEPVTRALWRAGCRTFFVALPQEAFELRNYLHDATVYCLGGLTPGGTADFCTYNVRPVLNTLQEVDEWRNHAKGMPAALHVDTGMTRLGLSLSEAQKVAQAQDSEPHGVEDKHLNLALILSHPACADEPVHPLNAQQLQAFKQLQALFPTVPKSLANSAGTLQAGPFVHNMARPGIALYGGQALTDRPNPMRPVITLEARVLQVREAKAGDVVGYGATHTLIRDSKVAILGVGYADGYHRLIGSSANAKVMINAKPAPLLGRVSMDLIAVDMTDHDQVEAGSYVALINEHHTIDDVARDAQTIGYEVLTGLGQRYERIYLGG